jgi:hypothetical protein
MRLTQCIVMTAVGLAALIEANGHDDLAWAGFVLLAGAPARYVTSRA